MSDQLSVLVRLMIGAYNRHAEQTGINIIKIEEITEMFNQWYLFKKSPRHREHFRAWCMGEDVSDIIAEGASVQDTPTPSLQEHPHVESDHGNQVAKEETAEEETTLAMSDVPSTHSAEDESTDREDG